MKIFLILTILFDAQGHVNANEAAAVGAACVIKLNPDETNG